MSTMLTLSLVLNVAVLVPVVASLLMDGPRVQFAFGPRTPARGILMSSYGAILVASVVFLVRGDVAGAAALLAVQVLYKVTTPFTVSLRNPVVLSNLGIAAWHAATLFLSAP